MSNAPALALTRTTRDGAAEHPLQLDQAVIAGWTSRDAQAMEKHIRELEEIGVARPASTPIYYRVGASRITTAGEIEVSGSDSSGEVEFVMFNIEGRLWIGVGSDHTDRKVETYSITVSKQMCDKPVAAAVWPWDEVAGHWDSLALRSYIAVDGRRTVYQEGSVAAMRSPLDLIERYTANGGHWKPGTVMFGGTLAAKGGIRPADRFEFEIVDDRLNRRIGHGYDVRCLPVAG